MRRLIPAFGADRTVVLFGVGPSAEIGLPTWEMLARQIAEEGAKIVNAPLLAVSKDIERGFIPKAIGDVERILNSKGFSGRTFVENVTKRVVKDNGREGKLYALMARLPAKLYMTTNYDEVFERHLKNYKMVPGVYTNNKESIEELDPSSYEKSILHVHGSTVHGGQLIITDTDYSRLMQADEYKPLRKVIESHLYNSAIVIMGYSLSDPDLQAIARRVTTVLRRKYPVLALIPDVDHKRATQFSLDYNIDIIGYSSDNGHKELRSILSTVLKWLEAPQESIVMDHDSLRMAQILYVYDAARNAGVPTIVAAVKSVILSAISKCPEGLIKNDLSKTLRDTAGAKLGEKQLGDTLKECLSEELVIDDGKLLKLSTKGHELVSVSNRKYERLWANLGEHVQLVVRGDGKIGELLQCVLVDIFTKRAAEAVALSIHSNPINTSSLSLFDLISQRSSVIVSSSKKLRFIDYVIEMLRKPNASQRAIIEHLGRCLFCTHCLRLDIDAYSMLRKYISGRTVILDSNILIPLLACESPNHTAISALLASAKSNGLQLITTGGFVQESQKHAVWARNFIEDNKGDQNVVLAAARGMCGYDGNEFLSGMIRAGNKKGKQISIYDYLHKCTGAATVDLQAIVKILKEVYEVNIIETREIENTSREYLKVRELTKEFIGLDNISGKTMMRMESEAEAYAIVHEWERIYFHLGCKSNVAILSSGGYLNRIAAKSPCAINRNIITTPYALGAFLSTYMNPSAILDFGAIIRSEYFNSASDFIEDVELERYFSGIIAAADRAYEDELRPRLEKLEIEIFPDGLPESLSEIDPVQRPEAVRSLSKVLSAYLDTDQINQLKKEKRRAEEQARIADERAKRAEKLLKKRRRGETKYKRAQKRREEKGK
ncbi:MAG: SIR2 family protein [Candidatus Eisenbacteria bacterium]|uniref:SIR2 family protein n=1 Tax=Eiseniibacteriota bacterium TaxID=2212470 RepID=A0A948RY84_UNCEI|nr:SIR2 family protein [Candidatus Eisenbacteria bacterium]MBU1951057.1 SIR2 family protein [Candidatus Eisenbacteria bacterium]MBU2691772.1 SIR2 family protein [Candidatus Eisenbacteria bacterium]